MATFAIKVSVDDLEDLRQVLAQIAPTNQAFSLAERNLDTILNSTLYPENDRGHLSLALSAVIAQVADGLRAAFPPLPPTPPARPRHVCAEIEPSCHLSTGECRYSMDGDYDY